MGKFNVMWLNGVYTSMSPDGYSCAVRIYPFNETVGTQQPVSSHASHGSFFKMNMTGISFILTNPQNASFRMFSIDGKLVVNLTSAIQAMKRGAAFVPFSMLSKTGGIYLIRLDDGKSTVAGRIVIPRS
jgi:hypothetical protein